MSILWYKKFYVTSNYETQEQVQGISGTTLVQCAPLISPKKFDREHALCMEECGKFSGGVGRETTESGGQRPGVGKKGKIVGF